MKIMMLNSIAPLLAQVLNEPVVNSPEDAALVFSGPQFFTALVAGVVLAFAFQLLLTNLGVAAGISLAGGSSSEENENEDSFGDTLHNISLVLGLGTLISVTVALFFASLLAVKLSLFISPLSGAIVGLVIWGTYFSLLVIVSSATIGSLVGSVVNAATAGFQSLMGTATAALGAKAIRKEVVDTAEASVAAIRRELGAALDPVTVRENLEDYFTKVRPQSLDFDKLAADFEKLLDQDELKKIAQTGQIPSLDRQTFVELIAHRSDFSQKDINRVADKLESVWRNITQSLPTSKNDIGELGDYIKTAPSEQLLGSEFTDKLTKLVKEVRKPSSSDSSNWLTQSLTMGMNTLISLAMGRTDLSQLDVDKIVDQINQIKEGLGEQTNKLANQVTKGETTNDEAIKADIKAYLLNTYPWQLRSDILNREFRNLLYDPDASPEVTVGELESISRSTFVALLKEKGLLTQAKIQKTANALEEIRLEVLNTAQAAIERKKAIALLTDVEQHLSNTSKEDLLDAEKVQIIFKPILEDADTEIDRLRHRLTQLDYPTLERMLEKRHDIEIGERVFVVSNVERVRDQVIQESQDNQAAIQGKIEQQWLKVKAYLKDTGKDELNPNDIQRELQLFLDDPSLGMAALRNRSSRFDRDTLVQLLNQRQDLSEEQINEVLDKVEENWTSIRSIPAKLTGQVEQQYEKVTSGIADYLRQTNKTELNPEGIQRDLTLLLEDPQMGAEAIKQRLAMMDRDTLVQLLSQRRDLSEADVNRIIDDVTGTLHSWAQAPQRLARRTGRQVQEFQATLADYLRSTDREELSPAGIKRDVQLLLHDPKMGLESLQERLSYFDRDTLVALLSQRDDISEEEVNRIIDRILEVRNQAVQQIEAIQQQVQGAINRILDKIRIYLDSLERPELNYGGIRDDLQTLMDDPQAGFDALRDRFSQVNRDTVVAILQSRDDISPAEAERMVAQVEHTRDRLLQRAERIQQTARLQLERVKEEAQKQAEATRKAAAVAAWWLFSTALISAIASAGAGILAVGG